MNQLKEYRNRLGVNQKMIAEMFDISQQMVSQIEQGKRQIPTNILERIGGSTLVKDRLLNEKGVSYNSNVINDGLLQTDTENDDFEALETSRKWEKWFWRTTNKLCRGCTQECKQSSKVKVIGCPQYEAIHESNADHTTRCD